MNKLSQMGIETWQAKIALPGAKVNQVLNAQELTFKDNNHPIIVLFEQLNGVDELISNIAKALNADFKPIKCNEEPENAKNLIKLDVQALYSNPSSKASLWQQIRSVLDSTR